MERLPQDTGRIYTATQLITMTTGAAEIFSLLASSLNRIEIMKLELQQNSTLPQAMSVEMFRGTSVSTGGSTGSAIVPAQREGWASALAAASSVTGRSTTLNSTSNSVRLHAGGFEVDSGKYLYAPDLPPIMSAGQLWNARVSAPSTAGALQIAASLTFRETEKIPS